MIKSDLVKIFTLFIFSLFLSNNLFCQSVSEKNDWEVESLKDKVKTLKFLNYEVAYLNDTTYITQIEGSIIPVNYILYFDEDGNKTKKVELRKETDSLIEKGVWEYFYKNGKIRKEIYTWNNHSERIDEWNYSYPHKDTTLIVQTVKSNGVWGNSPQYYSYVRKGNKEYYTNSNSDSSFVRRNLTVYDSYNRIIRFEQYENKEYLMDISFYSYKDTLSKKPDQVVSSYTKYDQPRPSIIRYKYNDHGDVEKTMGISQVDKEKISITEYEYDKRGNWIEKTVKNPKTGKIFKIYKREITYY